MTSNGHTSFIPIEEVLIECVHEHTHDDATITIDQLRHLVRAVDHSDIAELEVKHGASKSRLVLRKAKPVEGTSLPSQPYPSAEEMVQPVQQTHYTITASLVGTFQRWSKSKDKPFINVGDMITVGQHVGAIRSLDILNEIESAIVGRVIEMLVEHGQPIEYGQPLMTIERQ